MNARITWGSALLCALALSVAACSSPSAPNVPAPANTAATGNQPPAPAAAPTAASTPKTPPTSASNPLAALAQVVTTLNSVKSFRAHVTTPAAPAGGGGEGTMEIVLPDKFHMIAGQGEFIRIGNTMYIKLGPNKWTSGTLGQNAPSIQDPRTEIANLISSGGATFVGPDVLDGKPMLVYQFTPTAQIQRLVSGKLWVGATDGLPYEEQAISDGTVTSTITFYDYNADIQINPPSQ